ncbi:MAG: LemA family protein [Alphaproteobacteria bacterium]|nr:LemA family protein [Alphaproteobacteria bacterium]
MPVSYIVLAIIVLLIFAVVVIYNGLVKFKNLALEGWSGIDVQLKRRADLIPNLIETVKGYMTHERGVLETVTEMRAAAMKATDPAGKGKAEGMLSGALANLFAVAENYPDLKASQNFQELQKALAEIEDQIQLSRRYYNGAARNLNIQIQSFPNNLIAGMFRFQEMKYFEMENSADRNAPQVALRP